jgi:hypothetical protein
VIRITGLPIRTSHKERAVIAVPPAPREMNAIVIVYDFCSASRRLSVMTICICAGRNAPRASNATAEEREIADRASAVCAFGVDVQLKVDTGWALRFYVIEIEKDVLGLIAQCSKQLRTCLREIELSSKDTQLYLVHCQRLVGLSG